MLFSIFYTLADGFRILGRLAQAKADMTTAISDDHERANANRKGAIAALESALAAKEEHS